LKLAKPLTRQWLLQLLSAACLYCLLILGLHYYQGKQLQQAQLAALPRHVQQQFMPLLAQSVWDVDPATIQNLLQGILDMDGVVQVTLLNLHGQVQVQLGNGQLVSHQIELPIPSPVPPDTAWAPCASACHYASWNTSYGNPWCKPWWNWLSPWG